VIAVELLRYLFNNILKRPMRTAFILAAGVLSSVVLVFAFALGARITEHMRVDTMAKWTGHLWVSTVEAFTFKEERSADYARESAAVREYLAANPNVEAAVPWLLSYCEIQAGTKRQYVQIQATDFALDKPFRDNTELVSGAFPGPEDAYGIVVTTSVAAENSLKVGDSITMFISSAFGARNAMDFQITGISRASAPWYEKMVGLRAVDFLAMSELTELSPFYKVYVKDESRIPAMVADLAKLAPDFAVKGYHDDKFVQFLLSLGTSNVAMFGSMAMIIFLALLIGINSIILTNIFDRRDEIGTLRALGFSKNTVRNLFFGESLVSLFAGYLIGTLLVAALGGYFDSHIVRPPLLMLQYMFGMTRMSIQFTPMTVVAPFLVLFVLLFLASYRRIGIEAEKQAITQMANR
jgi:ABC-type lipoprotein release transport system permease subunit